ncbi:hypothetical protein ACJRO7_036347 [Eucalyptus globulus]|uniref:Sec20 C-terminal domain-containing protein n=1 Tax=Eucalyptus globulus TaxID=34317 RepID=A0ABD3IJU2_EUCGL
MDKVVEAVEEVNKEWGEAYVKTQEHIKAIEEYGKSREEKNSLLRLNGLAQDSLALLNSLQFKLDLLAPYLRMRLRNANLQVRANLKKTVQEERELLLGGGEESTIRRRNLQTKAGMTSAVESITKSFRRTCQLMVQATLQEVERSANTLMTVEELTGVLRKAKSEYKGHHSLLMHTQSLLSTTRRQDVINSLTGLDLGTLFPPSIHMIIIAVGFILFSCVVLCVVSKHIGLLKLQRKVTATLKAGMAR